MRRVRRTLTIRINAPLPASYDVALRLLTHALLEPDMQIHVPVVLEATRQALRQAPTPVPDPLEPVAKRILNELGTTRSPAYAAAALKGLTVMCTERDRQTVRLAILSI